MARKQRRAVVKQRNTPKPARDKSTGSPPLPKKKKSPEDINQLAHELKGLELADAEHAYLLYVFLDFNTKPPRRNECANRSSGTSLFFFSSHHTRLMFPNVGQHVKGRKSAAKSAVGIKTTVGPIAILQTAQWPARLFHLFLLRSPQYGSSFQQSRKAVRRFNIPSRVASLRQSAQPLPRLTGRAVRLHESRARAGARRVVD